MKCQDKKHFCQKKKFFKMLQSSNYMSTTWKKLTKKEHYTTLML